MRLKKRKNKSSKPTKLPKKFKPGFLNEFDGRTLVYEKISTIYKEVMSDMGGVQSLSHVQVCLAERFVFLEFVMRNIEKQIAENPKQSAELVGKWIQAINSLSGLAKTIGLKRQAKKIESLSSYVGGGKKKRKA